jgi:hypothetical protein
MKCSWVLLALGAPKILKAVGRKFGVTHRVLDVLVAEPSL